MTQDILDLTIVIPTKNEEKNIQLCLNAIGRNFAKEIVLIDSGSTDNTLNISRKFNVTILHFEWDGNFPKKRNWFLFNHPPKTKWVLFLDADEFLTENFKFEVRNKLKTSSHVGYWLYYTVYFLGKPLKGGYPLKKLALFQVGKGYYEKINETYWSHLDMEVHEHPIIDGSIGKIISKISHNDVKDLSHYINKHNEYSDWESKRYIHYLYNPHLKSKWTFFQKIKYSILGKSYVGIIYFFGSFILMRGFLDGKTGLLFSLMKLSYYTQIHCKIKELNEK